MNYAVQYNALIRRYETLIDGLREVLRLLRRGRSGRARALLESVVDSGSDRDDSSSEGSDDVERPAAVDAIADLGRSLLQQMRQPVLPPGVQTVQAFRGCIYRLD